MSAPKPLWIVAEDGTEYTERFARFLSGEFAFARGADFASVRALCERGGAAGLVLDLDFRRTPRALLVGDGDARVELQGIFILRALRERGVRLPAVLCADVDEAERRAALEKQLAPLSIAPSTESLPELARRLRALSRANR